MVEKSPTIINDWRVPQEVFDKLDLGDIHHELLTVIEKYSKVVVEDGKEKTVYCLKVSC